MVPSVTFSCEGTIVGSVTFYVTEYGAVALQFQLQSLGVQIPPYFLLMLPYLLSERAPHWSALARGAYIGLTRAHRIPTVEDRR